MHANNNKAVVDRISKRSAKANRTRNVFAALAIVLTTFLISTTFSVGISTAINQSIMNVRILGTAATIFLNNPTDEQVDVIQNIKDVKIVGAGIHVGSITQKTTYGEEADISVHYYDENEWEHHYLPAISGVNGSYPKGSDEVMMSVNALDQLGITNPKVNMDVSLSYATKHGEKTETFRLSGWFTNYKNFGNDGIGLALVSEQFYIKEGLSLEEDGEIAISVGAGKLDAVYSRLEQEVALEQDQEFNTTYDVGEENADVYKGVVIVICIFALFLVLSGYLLIYNVMYISVTKDIRFYGLLKTIGTSPKQIRKIVRSQMYRLSITGIPIGLALSLATSFLIVPKVMEMFGNSSGNVGVLPSNISFHPLIYIGTVLFVWFTIAVSCRKPAKIAGAVSPVEAIGYTGVKAKKKDRRSLRGGKLYRMAFYNVFREKKRAFLVFASLFMGTITLLSINGFLGSLKVENYINRYYPHDFVYQSMNPNEEQFGPDFMKELSGMDGVTNIKAVKTVHSGMVFEEEVLRPILKAEFERYQPELQSEFHTYEEFISNLETMDGYGTYLLVIDETYIETYNKNHEEPIDIEAFRRGEIGIIQKYEEDDLEDLEDLVGKELTLVDENSGNQKSVAVGGIFDYNDFEYARYSQAVGELRGICVSEAFMEKFTKDAFNTIVYLDVETTKEPAIKAKIKSINAKYQAAEFDYVAKTDVAKEFQTTITTMRVMSDGISILLILIGVLNFINVMMTGVHARRNELAVMESVGMTKKQVRKMLAFEGFYYAMITTLIIMTLGNGILYKIADFATETVDYAVFHYPVFLITTIISLLLIICISVPIIVHHVTAKESVTERLHGIEG